MLFVDCGFSIMCLALFTCLMLLSTSGRVSEAPMLLGDKRCIQHVYTVQRSGKAAGRMVKNLKTNKNATPTQQATQLHFRMFYLGMIKRAVHLLALWEEATHTSSLDYWRCCEHSEH